MLELGAGAGRNTLRYRGFERVALVDYSNTQLEQARARLGVGNRFVYVAANIYRLPFAPGLFDASTMIRTLHHMAKPQLALEQVRSVLVQGATFILEFANKQNLKAILRFWLRRQAWNPFSHDSIEFTALNFDFHPAAVRQWLQSSGFQINRQLTVSHYRMGFFKRWVPLWMLVRMDAAAQLTGNWWQLSPSVFVKAQATGQSEMAVSGVFFRCPACGDCLPERAADLVCPRCGQRWPYQDGIYDFREHN